MAARHVGRLALWVLACGAAPVLLGSAFGRRRFLLGASVGVFGTVWLVLWLPRAAHAAF
ncbi:MAG: hypothetical protein H7138_18370, partial [Myxococcales bacterium]|nr:hypothetical protein [Myxococcales bacterium]